MAKTALPVAIVQDFARVVTLLQSQGRLPPQLPAQMLSVARRIHASTYSLILWRFRLKRLTPHGQVFVDEIASDALQLLPQIMVGYSKTPKLLIRGIAENVLRHIYFSDHPVEFQKMNRETKWYQSIEFLCDYAKSHPVFLDVEAKFDGIARISALYSELSAGVHGRTVKDLEMRVALKKIAYDPVTAERDAKLVERGTEAVNFLIAMFHRQKMQTFQVEDRRILLRTLPAKARQVWTEHE